MKRFSAVTLGLILTLAAVPSFAGKVGFVEVERAAATVEEGQIALRELESWATPKRQTLERLAEKINDLRDQRRQQASVAAPEVMQRLEAREVEAQREYEDQARQLQRDFEAKQTELLREVATKLSRVIEDYSVANDFDVVMIFRPQTIIYLAESSDLTDTVIELYDERFPPAGRSR
jgi:Skp family chaperone for outer membrane proteins